MRTEHLKHADSSRSTGTMPFTGFKTDTPRATQPSKFAAAWYKPKWQEMRLNMGKPCRFKNQERQSSRDQSAAPVASAPYPETASGGWRVGPTAQSQFTYTHRYTDVALMSPAARPGSHPLQLSLCIDMPSPPPPSRHTQCVSGGAMCFWR